MGGGSIWELETRSKEGHQWQNGENPKSHLRHKNLQHTLSMSNLYRKLFLLYLITFIEEEMYKAVPLNIYNVVQSCAGGKGCILILHDCHFRNKTSFIISVISHSVTTTKNQKQKYAMANDIK